MARDITAADAVRVRIPLRRPFATAGGTWHEHEAWVIRLRDADGRTGVGEACLDPSADADAIDALAARVRTAIPTLAESGVLGRWLADAAGDDPIELALRAAIAGAALDLGLAAVGATGRATVRVNATIATEELDATVAEAQSAVDAGFDCLKIKAGSEPSTAALIERLAAVRAVVGSSVELRLDVNGAWDVPTAPDRLAALADLDVAYCEQPVAPGDVALLAHLRRSSPVRIAADESVTSRAAARALIDAGAVDVLVVKPARVGGVTAALDIARDAEAADLGVTISTLLETGVGIMAAARVAASLSADDAHGLATAGVLADDLLAAPLVIKSGRIAAPAAGSLVLDDAALDRWTIERVGRPA